MVAPAAQPARRTTRRPRAHTSRHRHARHPRAPVGAAAVHACHVAALGGERYLVSLAGDSEWVRNVRAAGFAVVRHGRPEIVRLVEIAPGERPRVIRAYLGKWALTRSPAKAARDYFGLQPHPSLEEIDAIADCYPVFRMERVP
jgi:hypothetical protein